MRYLVSLLVAVTAAAAAPPATGASSLQRLPVKDAITALTDPSAGSGFDPHVVATTADGRYVVLTVRTMGAYEGRQVMIPGTYVYDRTRQRLELVSASTTGVRGTGSGRSNIDQVDTGSISADGRYVVFVSAAPNLVVGDKNELPDVFLRDRSTRRTVRISLDARGREVGEPKESSGANTAQIGDEYHVAISRDGSRVLFQSRYDFLGDGGTGLTLFAWTRATRKLVAVDRVPGSKQGAGSTTSGGTAAMSGDGRYVVFTTAARLVPADTDDLPDVYRRDVVAGTTVLVTDAATDAALVPAWPVNAVFAPALKYPQATVDRTGRWVAFREMGPTWPGWHGHVAVRDLGRSTLVVVDGREKFPTSVSTDGNHDMFLDPVIADDGKTVVYTATASDGDVEVTHAEDGRTLHEAPVLFRTALGGTPVAITPNTATACRNNGCYTVDTGQRSVRADRAGIATFALGAGARTIVVVTSERLTADDGDGSDPTTFVAYPADLYVWRA